MSLTRPITRSLTRAITRALTAPGAGSSIFDPISLFAANEPGAFYDTNDLSTMFVDSAGTQPTPVNGLVGLQFDKSRGLVLGDSGTPTAWTNSVFPFDSVTPDGDGFIAVKSTATRTDVYSTNALRTISVGQVYKVTVKTGATNSLPVFCRFTATTNARSAGTAFLGVGANQTLVAYLVVTAAQSNANIGFTVSSAFTSGILHIESVTWEQLPGLHRYQDTTGFKPVLRGTPTGANLFTAYGTPGSGWVDSGGGVATATTSSAAIPTTTAAVIGRVYRVRYTATVTSGTVRLTFGGVNGATRAASGTYEEYITATTTAALSFAGVTSFTGTVSAIDARDVSADAVTAPYGLQFDGADDFLLTASANFTSTDEVTVCAGIQKLRDSQPAVFAELSENVGNFPGSFYIAAPDAIGTPVITFRSKGTLGSTPTTSGTILAPATSLFTGIGKISTDTEVVRINGAQVGSSSEDQGTGNFGNYPFYFGRRGGTSLPYSGLAYPTLIIGRLLTTDELTDLEAYTATGTGVTI